MVHVFVLLVHCKLGMFVTIGWNLDELTLAYFLFMVKENDFGGWVQFWEDFTL